MFSEVGNCYKILPGQTNLINYNGSLRRDIAPGGTCFFTLALRNRKSRLLTRPINLLSDAFRHVKEKYPFKMGVIVVLPDHRHAVWSLPDACFNYSLR
ncbi:TPA: hypothetical protein I8034_003026 [Legionella pneumophila]|nr:hypothetical protein [Legionella pneumophila subsp. fraseri]HAT1773608.1 hypothetical protein [Legionella pneumophila]MDX1847795.1 hypothetical protein [Legionella pneumophila subsp. fraseri]HAT2128369.1 hypothetical protein [Legionella pneumophila]HAT2137510.1 hypothetical protein [Legionella pneumophila]